MLKSRFNSFKYALNGLKIVLLSEVNMRIHLMLALLAVVLGLVVELSTIEWMVIFVCIGMVFFAEIINTLIEKYLDIFYPEFNPKVGELKDIAAASVLIVAIMSLIIGLLLFIPKILEMI